MKRGKEKKKTTAGTDGQTDRQPHISQVENKRRRVGLRLTEYFKQTHTGIT